MVVTVGVSLLPHLFAVGFLLRSVREVEVLSVGLFSVLYMFGLPIGHVSYLTTVTRLCASILLAEHLVSCFSVILAWWLFSLIH